MTYIMICRLIKLLSTLQYLKMQNKNKINKEKAKNFGKEVLSKINGLIREHNDKIRKLNIQIQKQNKIHRVVVNKGDSQVQEEFYQFAQDTAEKLKLMADRLSEAQKIKKQRREIYNNKLTIMISLIHSLVDEKSMKVFIDQNTIKWIKQQGEAADQIHISLGLLEKQSKGFCFGGNNNTKNQIEKSVIDIISYCQIWQFLQKASPQIQRQTQHKYVQLDYNESIFFDMDKMVTSAWPQPEIIEVQVEKIIERVVVKQPTKQAVSQKILPQSSFKQEAQKRQLQQKCQRLQKDFSNEKSLRQAHEMLIGLGRSKNIGKAIQKYMSIPQMSQSQAKQSIKYDTQLKINPIICNILGCLHQQGKYVPKDLKKAVQFYIKSASVQDPEGMYKIGKFLQKRLVNSKQLFEQEYANRKEEMRDSIEYYQKAAQKGHLDAITDLGHIYQNGIHYEQIRQQNSVVSNSQISNQNPAQFIIEPNLEYAIKYYQLAKKEEFPRALNNLGALYIRMKNQIPETMKGTNQERGIKYLKRATELLYPKAFLNLGKCFENGLGVNKNFEKAKTLYIQGSDLGDYQCKLELVKCLIHNQLKINGKQDLKMTQYLRQVVVNDPTNAEAQHLLGTFYEKGFILQKSPQNAFYHISKAAKLEYPQSLVKMGDYYYSGFYIQKNIKKAKYYYEKAGLKGNSQGLINLGILYQKGLIETQSKDNQPQKAKYYYLEAAKMGNPNAFIFLNKQKNKDSTIIKEAAQMGSQQALKILAKTNTTAKNEATTLQMGKQQYGIILNRYIKQSVTAKTKENIQKQTKKTQLPYSQKMRKMLIYSPRSRMEPSLMVSPRYNSPQSYRSQGFLPRK